MQYEGKSYSVAALVLGIVSAALACFYGVNAAALVCGIVGIFLAVKGKKYAVAAGAPTGMATAGLILSIIGTVLAGIGFVACTLCVGCISSAASASLLNV